VLPYTWSWTLPFFGYVMLPWRLLIFLYSLPGLVGAIGIFMMPESPKFLSSQKRDKQALAAIHWLWTKNTGNSIASFPYTALIPVEPDRLQPDKVHGIWEFFKSIGGQVLPLFRRPYVWQYSICCFIMLSIYAS
jgi:Sugar (and other) transporter